ncbi:DUF6634 family protein [Rhizobium sp. R86522]|uniref:DUF6634 family protein n=1 Tax=Rhizobium sp. R86522 TaxID=3093861 RepID=UPI00366C4B93
MTFVFDDPRIMQRVLHDLEKLQSGKLDTSEILTTAPLLEDHRLVLGWCHAMKGIVTRHPLLPDGNEVVTSQLIYMNPDIGLARTLSRWYRLGTPRPKRGH